SWCTGPHDTPRRQRGLCGHFGRRARLTGDVRLAAAGVEARRYEPGEDPRGWARRLWPRQADQARTPAPEAATLPALRPLVPEAGALPCAVRSAAGAEWRVSGKRRLCRGSEARADAPPHHADRRVVRREALAPGARSPCGGVRTDAD